MSYSLYRWALLGIGVAASVTWITDATPSFRRAMELMEIGYKTTTVKSNKSREMELLQIAHVRAIEGGKQVHTLNEGAALSQANSPARLMEERPSPVTVPASSSRVVTWRELGVGNVAEIDPDLPALALDQPIHVVLGEDVPKVRLTVAGLAPALLFNDLEFVERDGERIGLKVPSLDDSGILENLGLTPQDIIRVINGRRVQSRADVAAVMAASRQPWFDLEIEREGRQKTLSIVIGD